MVWVRFEVPRYCCPYCRAKFYSFQGLATHLKVVHKTILLTLEQYKVYLVCRLLAETEKKKYWFFDREDIAEILYEMFPNMSPDERRKVVERAFNDLVEMGLIDEDGYLKPLGERVVER